MKKNNYNPGELFVENDNLNKQNIKRYMEMSDEELDKLIKEKEDEIIRQGKKNYK